MVLVNVLSDGRSKIIVMTGRNGMSLECKSGELSKYAKRKSKKQGNVHLVKQDDANSFLSYDKVLNLMQMRSNKFNLMLIKIRWENVIKYDRKGNKWVNRNNVITLAKIIRDRSF